MKALFLRAARGREARAVLGFSLGNLIAAMVGNRLLTECAAPRDLGRFYMYMNVAQWLAVPGMAAYHFIYRYWLAAKSAGASRTFFGLIAKGTYVAIALAAVAVAAIYWSAIDLPASVALPLWLTGASLAAGQAVAPVPAAERRRVVVGAMGFATTALRYVVLSAGVALIGMRTGEQMMWIQAALSVILAMAAWRIFHLSVNWSDAAGMDGVLGSSGAREILRFAGPYLVTAVLMQFASTSERWGLARLDDPGATALFVLSVGFSTAGANALAAPLLLYFQPLVAEATARGDAEAARRHLRDLTLGSGVVLTFAALVAFGAAPIAAKLLFGVRYNAIASMLPWTTVGACSFALGQALAMYPFAARDSVGPNLAHAGGLVIYASFLVVYRPEGSAALAFSKVYAVAYLGYAAVMTVLAYRWAKRLKHDGARVWELRTPDTAR